MAEWNGYKVPDFPDRKEIIPYLIITPDGVDCRRIPYEEVVTA